jgi:hypothetical protein
MRRPSPWAQVRAWLRQHVPRIDPDGPRAAYYVQHWNVRAKIRREQQTAKLAGTFYETADRTDQSYTPTALVRLD